MIGKLFGIVDSIYDDHLIINVSGVGYLVFCSTKTLGQIQVLQKIELLIETYVREDNISLFGFNSQAEKISFVALQSVSGIGTRMALAILSRFTPDELGRAVMHKDKEAFRSVSGVGPKLAERLLVELKGKSFGGETISIQIDRHAEHNHIIEDATSALVNLGMQRSEIYNVVRAILKENPDVALDQVIRSALQKRVKG